MFLKRGRELYDLLTDWQLSSIDIMRLRPAGRRCNELSSLPRVLRRDGSAAGLGLVIATALHGVAAEPPNFAANLATLKLFAWNGFELFALVRRI